MSAKRVIALPPADRAELERLTKAGAALARVVRRANALLLADAAPPRDDLPAGGPAMTDEAIAAVLACSPATVARTRAHYLRGGLPAVREARRPGPTRPRLLDQAAEAHFVALACSRAPDGRDVWTVRLLRDRFVELACASGWVPAGGISHETVRQALKKTNSDPTASRRT